MATAEFHLAKTTLNSTALSDLKLQITKIILYKFFFCFFFNFAFILNEMSAAAILAKRCLAFCFKSTCTSALAEGRTVQ